MRRWGQKGSREPCHWTSPLSSGHMNCGPWTLQLKLCLAPLSLYPFSILFVPLASSFTAVNWPGFTDFCEDWPSLPSWGSGSLPSCTLRLQKRLPQLSLNRGAFLLTCEAAFSPQFHQTYDWFLQEEHLGGAVRERRVWCLNICANHAYVGSDNFNLGLTLRNFRQKENPTDCNSPVRGLLPNGCTASSITRNKCIQEGEVILLLGITANKTANVAIAVEIWTVRVEFHTWKKLHFGPKWEAESFLLKNPKITEARGSTL